MMKTKKLWYITSIRLNQELVSALADGVTRTGLNEQELMRQALKKGIPLLEDKPAI